MHCKNGKHNLKVIYWHRSLRGNEEPTVRWCQNCGAVVVDIDFDGRVEPGAIRKMELPLNTKEVNQDEANKI